jgi:hypothetical protein
LLVVAGGARHVTSGSAVRLCLTVTTPNPDVAPVTTGGLLSCEFSALRCRCDSCDGKVGPND